VAFKKRVDKAGRTLFYLAGIFIVATILNFFELKDSPGIAAVVIPGFVLGAIFLVLGEYSKKKMLGCFISGLCLFVIIQLIHIFNTPEFDLFYTVFVVIIIVYLVLGVKSAVEIEKIKKEHNLI
jgi:peptidoglycan/LPS O-acetylase OafA/YrhL